MEKCRICLKYRKKIRSVYDAADGVTFLDMITSFSCLKIPDGANFPSKICLSCCKKLIETYTFKIDIERSETILHDLSCFKRIIFNNIHEIEIPIDYKPLVPHIEDFHEKLFKKNTKTITYNDTLITRLKEINNDELENITVKDFLSSVKIEYDDDFNDQDNCKETDYESDDDYKFVAQSRLKKKTKTYPKKNCTLKGNLNKCNKKKECSLVKPIKPIYVRDAIIKHTEAKVKNYNEPKKKYKYQPSVCPYCGKLLGSKHIKNHMLQHIGEKSYKCDMCTKTFYTEQGLNQHKKRHSDPKQFKCDLCIASFFCKATLKGHMLVHTEEKNHICDICHKGFKRKHALRRHVVIHNFGKKAIQCELCPMTFHTKYFLQHHMRVHTGERPYRCDICSQPYSYKHDFNRHCFKKHSVFLKRRSINIMNEEVLQQERALMRDLALRAHGVIKKDNIPSVFEGPQGALAFEQAMKAVEARLIPS